MQALSFTSLLSVNCLSDSLSLNSVLLTAVIRGCNRIVQNRHSIIKSLHSLNFNQSGCGLTVKLEVF